MVWEALAVKTKSSNKNWHPLPLLERMQKCTFVMTALLQKWTVIIHKCFHNLFLARRNIWLSALSSAYVL